MVPLLLLLLLVSESPGEAPEAWITFRVAEAGIAVDLPESPVRTRSSRLTAVGRIHAEELVAFRDRAEFRVELHGIPAVARWILSDASLLERATRDLLRDEGAVGARETSEQVAGHPARHVVYTDARGRPGEARFVLAGRRLVLMAALWPAEDAERAGRERFFSSLALDGARDPGVP